MRKLMGGLQAWIFVLGHYLFLIAHSFSLSEQIMSADKYPCIFSRQMAAIVYITPARVDICPPIVSVEEKHSQRNNFNIFFPYLTWEETKTCVTESSDSDIKKLMASAVPESTKKSPKHAINVFEGDESHE